MSKIRLHGSSSGYTEIAPVAASGNNTLTLPNDGTIISKDSNGAVGVTSVTVGTGVTIGDGRVTCTTLHGSAANCTQIPAANIVGVCTSGLTKTGGFSLPTDIDAWAVSSAYSASSGSNTMTTNWYQFSTASDTHFPKIGDSMSQSSGIWTFPKTGIWTVDFVLGCYNVDNNSGTYFGFQMFFSTDTGSSYDRIYTAYGNMTSDDDHGELFVRAYIDVTNVSTNRLKFNTNMAASKTIFGDADEMRTGAIFTRIGDT